jgi:hypothetical protein
MNFSGDSKVESLTEDVVTLLNFLTDKVAVAAKLVMSSYFIEFIS